MCLVLFSKISNNSLFTSGKCAKLEEELGVTIFIGNQGDVKFWNKLKPQLPVFDIVLDDGGHRMHEQLITFSALFPGHIHPDGGIFLCEDLHTSYWSFWGGGYLKKGTFIEHMKELVDDLNAHHSHDPAHKITAVTKSAHSITFYDSIVVLERRPMTPPVDILLQKKPL